MFLQRRNCRESLVSGNITIFGKSLKMRFKGILWSKQKTRKITKNGGFIGNSLRKGLENREKQRFPHHSQAMQKTRKITKFGDLQWV